MIETWTAGNPDHCMPEEILVELLNVIPQHPWWKARALLTVALLRSAGVCPPASVLDAGCGWGVTLETLERSGYAPAGLDVSRQVLEEIDKTGRVLIEADLTQPLPSGKVLYDAVLALDVIEHLDDDRAAVKRLAELARPGGVVIVSVPALPDLYSEFDAVQGHRRRYLPETLRAAFAESTLDLEHVLWWGSWMVPVLRRQRNNSRKKADESPAETYHRYLSVPRWPLSTALRLAFALDQSRTLRRKSRIGTSLFAIARRPA